MYVMITKGRYWSTGMEGHVFKTYKETDEHYYVDPERMSTRRLIDVENAVEIKLPYGVTVDNETGLIEYAGETFRLVKRHADKGDLVLVTYFDHENVAAIRGVEGRAGVYKDLRLDDIVINDESYLDSDADKYFVMEPFTPVKEEDTPAPDLAYEPMDMLPEDEPDTVNHPNHYTTGKFEVIEMIEEVTKGYEDPFIGYTIGNVQKYIARAPHKGKLIEDLEKARKYLDFAIEHLKG